MKSAVWTHQFLVALAEHPEFTAEQRAVLHDAIRVVTPELFDVPFASPDWTTRVDEPLHDLERRARAAFGDATARLLFAQLGPDDPPRAMQAIPGGASGSNGDQPNAAPSRRRVLPEDLPNCSCSTVNDWCAAEFGPQWYCLGGGCVWGVNWGCGAAFAYPCNGLCDLKKFQG